MVSAWRFRRCPHCDTVNNAGNLINHHFGAAWNDGSALTECPECGYHGPRSDFYVVREDHATRKRSGGDYHDLFLMRDMAWTIVKDQREMTRTGHGSAVMWARAFLELDSTGGA